MDKRFGLTAEDDLAALLLEELNAAIREETNAEIIAIIKGEKPAPPAPPPLPNPGVLGIIGEGNRRYRVRGYGTEDRRFHAHVRNLVTFTGEDWPWAYFNLDDGVTHETMISGFEQHYLGEDCD